MNQLAEISVNSARLPQTYANAKTALYNCISVDECQSWADKAAALASYAKQANDDELMKMATRIRDRAIRRAGQLLKQIEPQDKGGDRKSDHGVGVHTVISRADAAREAGLSKHQQVQAIRVANVPAADFEKQVESQTPPTVTALAEQGKKLAPAKPVIDLNGRDPEEFNRAMHYVGGWESAAQELADLNHDAALIILNDTEKARLRAAITAIDAVTDRIITRI